MIIKGKQAILQKLVFQLRYRYGYTFLDKCGRTMNSIMREQSEWIMRGDITPQGAGLVSLRNSCLFSFSAYSYDFSLEKPHGGEPLSDENFKDFVEQVVLLSDIVNDQLGLKEFSRIGFRAWYLFPCQDKEESEMWLNSLEAFSINSKLPETFGGKIEATNLAVVISGNDRNYRIAFNSVESHAQMDAGQEILNVRASSLHRDQKKHLVNQMKVKRRLLVNPDFASLIDIDAFNEEPLSVYPRDFIETSFTNFSHYLKTIG